jgi:tetratricopeptide (TPR) repeat protein
MPYSVRWRWLKSPASLIGAGALVWLAAVYLQHTEALNTYFKSNVVLAQDDDYAGLTLFKMLQRRVAGVIHVGAGRDGFLAKTAEILVPGLFGLLGIASRFRFRKPALKPYELFAAIWFVGLIFALGLLSYRPLRYLALLTPSVCLLALSLLVRLARGEPVIASDRPRWFVYLFGFWLGWLIIHLQQEFVFQVMTGGKVVLVNEMNDFQKSLYTYQFMVFRQLLIYGGVALALTLFFHKRISSGNATMGRRASRRLFALVVAVVVAAGVVRFGWYASDRKYSVVESARSLDRVLAEGIYLVGDCSALISLETNFKTLPSYGDLIRHEEKERFEQYPVTHFILRFPTLFNYLSRTYEDFEEKAVPVRIFGLCGREATVVRYESWPGYASSGYEPTAYEQAVEVLRDEDAAGARSLFERYLEQHPDSYESLWGVALCYTREDRWEDARITIEKALRMTQRDALCFEAYADVLISLGQRARAVEYFRKAQELSPNSRRIARKLGEVRGMADD